MTYIVLIQPCILTEKYSLADIHSRINFISNMYSLVGYYLLLYLSVIILNLLPGSIECYLGCQFIHEMINFVSQVTPIKADKLLELFFLTKYNGFIQALVASPWGNIFYLAHKQVRQTQCRMLIEADERIFKLSFSVNAQNLTPKNITQL